MQRVICCLKEIPAGRKQSVRGELETELEHFALRLLKEGVSLDLYGTKEKEVDVLAFEDLRDCLFLTNDREFFPWQNQKEPFALRIARRNTVSCLPPGLIFPMRI